MVQNKPVVEYASRIYSKPWVYRRQRVGACEGGPGPKSYVVGRSYPLGSIARVAELWAPFTSQSLSISELYDDAAMDFLRRLEQ
jgi:hypothetical protein